MLDEKGLTEKEMGIEEFRKVNYEGCFASLGKGQVIDIEKKLAEKTIVTDTGAFSSFLEKYADKTELTDEDINNIYKESIASGIIDHHSIDAFLHAKGISADKLKCSTKMVADYKENILKLIKEKEINKVDTHFDSDMDAICSSYLVKNLIDNNELPKIAEDLADLVNKMDYGKFNLKPEEYVNSLPGTIVAIKNSLQNKCQLDLDAQVFSKKEMKEANGRLNSDGVKKLSEIKARYENLGNETIFKLLDQANEKKNMISNFDLNENLNEVEKKLDEDVQKDIQIGREEIRKNYELFLADFEKAEIGNITIKNKKGNNIEIDIMVASSKTPLAFTNLSYMHTRPETIIAVYAGEERKGGDKYDVGITPDQTHTIDLTELCLALNQAEKEKRDEIYAKAENERTSDEQKLIETWEGQPDRDTFARDIIKKDPTVLVAGGSLIAASRTSLLTKENFNKIIKKYILAHSKKK